MDHRIIQVPGPEFGHELKTSHRPSLLYKIPKCSIIIRHLNANSTHILLFHKLKEE